MIMDNLAATDVGERFYRFRAGLYDSDGFEPRTNVWRRQIAIV